MTDSYPRPVGLGARATWLWDAVCKDYGLRTDEMLILEEACREVDLVDAMRERQRREDLLAAGSMGQVIAAPLVTEIRMHRVTLAGLLRQLKLPDTSDSRHVNEALYRSHKARVAAHARWGRSGGV